LSDRLPEEQRSDHLAGQVDRRQQADRRRRHVQGLGLGQRVGDRAGHGDFEAVENPGHAEGDDHPGVEPGPGEPVDAGRDQRPHPGPRHDDLSRANGPA
jgi:hypothetical protein